MSRCMGSFATINQPFYSWPEQRLIESPKETDGGMGKWEEATKEEGEEVAMVPGEKGEYHIVPNYRPLPN